MNANELLSGARDLINKYGYTVGSWGNKERGFCILGALNYVYLCNIETTQKTYMTVIGKLLLHLGISSHLTKWSDLVGKEKVLQALEEAQSVNDEDAFNRYKKDLDLFLETGVWPIQ